MGQVVWITFQKLKPLTANMPSLSLVSIQNWSNLLCLEKAINKKKRDFKDINAAENINKLNKELMDVNKIMTESFEMLLNRDRNLKEVSQKST